eukprot:m.80548 g.80548  ORF g.80548 m.80548 type:complete len:567 (-) comp19388_c0_seq1:523-2223(-)
MPDNPKGKEAGAAAAEPAAAAAEPVLEDDDDFEEFPKEDAAEEDKEDGQQWDTSWDDDSVEDNFSKQMRNVMAAAAAAPSDVGLPADRAVLLNLRSFVSLSPAVQRVASPAPDEYTAAVIECGADAASASAADRRPLQSTLPEDTAMIVWAPDDNLKEFAATKFAATIFGTTQPEIKPQVVQRLEDVVWGPVTTLVYAGHAVGGASTFAALLGDPTSSAIDLNDPRNYRNMIDVLTCATTADCTHLTFYVAGCCSLGAVVQARRWRQFNGGYPVLRLFAFGQEQGMRTHGGQLVPACVAVTQEYLRVTLQMFREYFGHERSLDYSTSQGGLGIFFNTNEVEFNNVLVMGRKVAAEGWQPLLDAVMVGALLGKGKVKIFSKGGDHMKNKGIPAKKNADEIRKYSKMEALDVLYQADGLPAYPKGEEGAVPPMELRHANLTADGKVGSIATSSTTGTELWHDPKKASCGGLCFEDGCILQATKRIDSGNFTLTEGETILVSQEKEPCSERCKALYLGFAVKHKVTLLVHYHTLWETASPTPGASSSLLRRRSSALCRQRHTPTRPSSR